MKDRLRRLAWPRRIQIPVRAFTEMGLKFRPAIVPNSSISYSVASSRPEITSTLLSPDTLICLCLPDPSESLIINVSKISSGAVHCSIKPSGLLLEAERSSTLGSASRWTKKYTCSCLLSMRSKHGQVFFKP